MIRLDHKASVAMSLLPQPFLADSLPAYEQLRESFGFVPAIFRAQTLLPRLIEAEARMAGAVLLTAGALTRVQKETILLVVAASHRNRYCVAAHAHFLRELGISADQQDRLLADYRKAGLPPADAAVLEFAVALGRDGAQISGEDIATLRAFGLSDQHIL